MTDTYTDPQSSPRIVSGRWPPANIWDRPVEPVDDVRIVVDPAAEHVDAGRRNVARFASESSVALSQLRSWLRADRNTQHERLLDDVLYHLEGILERYDPEGVQ